MNDTSRMAPARKKLRLVAADDFPAASTIMVSFPDKWQWVSSLQRENSPLYVAVLPTSYEQTRANQFWGLPPEINRSLTAYRLYKLFEAWPQPVFLMAWDEAQKQGRLLAYDHLDVYLQPVGQAQVWFGSVYAVIWECYLYKTLRRQDAWHEELTWFWQSVEADLGVEKMFTQPHEPAFGEGYPEFLTHLGYAPDPDFERWWSKAFNKTDPIEGKPDGEGG